MSLWGKAAAVVNCNLIQISFSFHLAELIGIKQQTHMPPLEKIQIPPSENPQMQMPPPGKLNIQMPSLENQKFKCRKHLKNHKFKYNPLKTRKLKCCSLNNLKFKSRDLKNHHTGIDTTWFLVFPQKKMHSSLCNITWKNEEVCIIIIVLYCIVVMWVQWSFLCGAPKLIIVVLWDMREVEVSRPPWWL